MVRRSRPASSPGLPLSLTPLPITLLLPARALPVRPQPQQYILFESALGYSLFETSEAEEIGALKATVQASVTDLSRFSKLVKLTAFQPYTSAENALQNINDVSEGIVNEDLKTFLEANTPKTKPGKSAKFVIGASAMLEGVGDAAVKVGTTLTPPRLRRVA